MALIDRTPRALALPLEEEIEARWQDALAYFKGRKSVLFVSYCRFWEKHAFVQQSLAKMLVENGVKVTWLDGWSWQPYQPVKYFDSPLLQVRSGVSLPFRRVDVLDKLTKKLQHSEIKRTLGELGGDPVLWVQAGVENAPTSILPKVDVLSTFDDPYRNHDESVTTRDAKVIVCQNSFTYSLLKPETRSRAFVSLPPVDMGPSVFKEARIVLPPGFPKKLMGYIGSFFGEDYDLAMFENFLKCFPDWGFLLMGRTRDIGHDFIRDFCRYPNFIYFPWVPRSQVAAAWKLLDVCLLFYRPQKSQDGAFPTKILESLHFGVPAVATSVPKTLDLEGFFPRSSNPVALQQMALDVQSMSPQQLQHAYDHFAFETDPRLHLARVAEALQGKRVVGLEGTETFPLKHNLKIVPSR